MYKKLITFIIINGVQNTIIGQKRINYNYDIIRIMKYLTDD